MKMKQVPQHLGDHDDRCLAGSWQGLEEVHQLNQFVSRHLSKCQEKLRKTLKRHLKGRLKKHLKGRLKGREMRSELGLK